MLIDEQYRQCVAFLYADGPDRATQELRRSPIGTAFFVSIELGTPGNEVALYAVTARHVVDMSKGYGLHPLNLRVNTRDGGYQDILMPETSWTVHHSTDVAGGSLVEARYDSSRPLDIKHLGLELILTDHEIHERERTGQPVGVGDDVFFAGLFTPHPGQVQNQPVTRFGNISLMPGERIRVATDDQGGSALIDAYLVEAWSRGGHSGSPAFHFNRIDVNTLVGAPAVTPRLLGLVQGHFDETSDLRFLGDLTSTTDNAGMAVVVPAQYIVDLLTQDELAAEREEYAQRLPQPAARSAVPTGSQPVPPDADTPLSGSDFVDGPWPTRD